MKPWSSIQKSLKSFDRYLLPVSQAKVTTRFADFCSRHQRSAAATSVPVEEPTSSPSFRRISRAIANDSASGMLYALRHIEKSQISGMKSSPMPSTSQEPARP